ncbi:low molecular weight phosphotyrosine protein phosphatase [Thermoleophilia bacterium SCSIO 60948]|nr:low molecular weight phosphotyrosine protein phosphatase [Thermoleophilia bacterium SCSIO 60948]
MAEPTRILFVCLGNICRSPTAEAVMRSRVDSAGLAGEVEVDSAGTGDWHVGHPPDARATAAGSNRGIDLAGEARTVEPADFERFDRIVAMDSQNLSDLERLAPDDAALAKLSLLRDHDPLAVESGERDVPDPYYGGDDGFEHVLDVVERGCDGLLRGLGTEPAER